MHALVPQDTDGELAACVVSVQWNWSTAVCCVVVVVLHTYYTLRSLYILESEMLLSQLDSRRGLLVVM